jgi:MSHA biogenesis protein MshQ
MADASTAGCSTQGSRAQNATGSSYATDHNGSTYLTAGSDFDLVVRAVLWETGDDNNVVGGDGVPDSEGLLYNNSCTGSFGKENTPETVTVSLSNFRPTSGSNGQLGGAASQVISGFNNGFSYITTDYDEVGIVDLAGALTSASYLGSGVNVTGTLNNLGRFYPHYFSVTPNTPELNDATGWACDFTYQGQQFDFFTDVVLTVQAREADGEVTEKYDGDYYKLDAPDPSVTFSNSASGAVAVLTDHSASPSVSVTDQNDYDGETLMTFSGYLLAYEKAAAQPVAQDAPFQAVINWILPAAELTDTDGACVNNPASCADVTVADISGTEVRYGRAVVANNSGSELMPLELGLRTEYWDEVFAASGRYAFSVHTDDTCSDDVWSDTDLTLSQFTGNLSDGSPGDVDVSLGTFDAGAGDILLANPSNSNQGPGAGNEGSVNVTLDVDDWLKYDFFGRGVENPVGTGTFGVYSGRQPVFYMRESYR